MTYTNIDLTAMPSRGCATDVERHCPCIAYMAIHIQSLRDFKQESLEIK